MPKKIRACCLSKYPDWVQSMVGSGQSPGLPHGSTPNTTVTSGRPPLPVR